MSSVENERRLHDKVILIVGGSSGLGLSAARACAAHGAQLVLVGRDEAKLQAAVGSLAGPAYAVAGDAGEPATAQQAVRAAVAQFGRLDGLYHVAGGSGRRAGDGPLDQITDQGWESTLRLNLHSLFYSNRAAVQQFLQQGSGGVVLNMSSVLAFSPAPRHFATHTYAATKAGAIGLTQACAAYYARHNIRFNALAPALVETPLAQRALSDPEIMHYVRSKQPLDGGRVSRPEDLDEAVVYLLSDAARLLTGQVLAVDGGWSLTEGQYRPEIPGEK